MSSAIRVAPITILAFLLAGCSSLVVDGHNLDKTSWLAVSVVGQAPIRGSEPTLKFEGGLVGGSMGCNTYTSHEAVTMSGNSIEIGETLRTTGRCIDTGGGDAPVMAIEFAFIDALEAADHIAFRGEQLVLSGPKGELAFERQP
jgi:heat shock protein HslJ